MEDGFWRESLQLSLRAGTGGIMRKSGKKGGGQQTETTESAIVNGLGVFLKFRNSP